MTNAMLNDAPHALPALPLPAVTEPVLDRDVIERVEAVFAEGDVIERVEAVFAEIDSLWDLLEAPEPPASLAPAAPSAPGNELPDDLRVSVVIPVYNEKRTVLDVIASVKALPFETEIIVVDDASTDGTPGWLETIRGASGLELILKDATEGKGAAVRDGFAAATGNIVVVQDAAREYDPRDIERVIRPIVAGNADAVYGSRYLERGKREQSVSRRLANWALTKASNVFSGLRLTDMETCQKAFRANVLRGLPLQQNRFGFEPEVTAKLARRKYRVVERSVRYRPRVRSQGQKRGLLDALNAMYCVARYGWRD